MQADPMQILGWARWICLIACFVGAAWLDHNYRRIPNDYWIAWAKPAIFLWVLELLIVEADWMVWATASAAVALASTAVIGRPDLSDIKSGNPVDIVVSVWYMFGIAGVIGGSMVYGSTNTPLDIIAGTVEPMAKLWWSSVSVLVQIWLFDTMWKLRLLHGGADAKALMLVAILLPTWATIPPIFQGDSWSLMSAHMPPAFALLIWGALAFLAIPLILIIRNTVQGNISSFNDMKLAWHATRMPLDQVMDNHVWLLDEVIDKPDGTTGVHTRIRAPSKTPSDDKLMKQINALKEIGEDVGWVTHKWPLLTILLPAILPMIMLGDPFVYMLAPLLE